MNKILIGKKVIFDGDNVTINKNKIEFLSSGNYEVEYVDDGKYNYTFIVNDDVNILEYSFDKTLVINNNYIVNNGKLEVIKFYNNNSVHENINIDLCSKDSAASYKFSNICKQEEIYEINVNHKVGETKSDIINKSVALKNSKLHFVINSKVGKGSNGSVLNQITRIVTMGDCDAAISPNMFIDLDDVEAKHGSIIGTFKDDEIFYLMSKGINYNDSLKLLIKGYILSNMIANHEIRKRIIDIIDSYWR